MVFYLLKLDQYFKGYELFEFNSKLFLLFQAGPQVGPGRFAGRHCARRGRPQSRPSPGARPGHCPNRPASWPAQAGVRAGPKTEAAGLLAGSGRRPGRGVEHGDAGGKNRRRRRLNDGESEREKGVGEGQDREGLTPVRDVGFSQQRGGRGRRNSAGGDAAEAGRSRTRTRLRASPARFPRLEGRGGPRGADGGPSSHHGGRRRRQLRWRRTAGSGQTREKSRTYSSVPGLPQRFLARGGAARRGGAP